MITLYGFGRVHRQVIGETRDLRAQWALEEPARSRNRDDNGRLSPNPISWALQSLG